MRADLWSSASTTDEAAALSMSIRVRAVVLQKGTEPSLTRYCLAGPVTEVKRESWCCPGMQGFAEPHLTASSMHSSI